MYLILKSLRKCVIKIKLKPILSCVSFNSNPYKGLPILYVSVNHVLQVFLSAAFYRRLAVLDSIFA